MKLGSLNDASSFALRRKNGEISTRGTPSRFLGYSTDGADGVWTNWHWDGTTFQVSTDRYGIYPTYYFKAPQAFAVSTSIPELLNLGVDRELDDAAIAVFLRLGFFLGDDTPFRNIRALPAGATIQESAGVWTMDQSRLPKVFDGKPMLRAAAIDEFGIRFQSAVDQIASTSAGRICLPLSGGRDSRHILFALVHGGNRPTCCATLKHFPPKSNEDARIAATVAAELGVPHVVLEPSRDPINAELEKNRLTNFCADEHAWILELSRFIRKNKYDTLYDGIAGDVLSAGLFLTQKNLDLYRHGNLVELAEGMLGSDDVLASMLNRDSLGRWRRELALERLVEELAIYAAHPNPVGQFYFWNRTRREIALKFHSILGRDARVFSPFLATPVYDLLSALPAEYFFDHSFHSEAIARNYPQYAHLPYEAKDAPPTRQRWFDTIRWTRQMASYCVLSSRESHVRRSYLIPRLFKGLVDPDYAMRQLDFWTMPLYLEQLARTA